MKNQIKLRLLFTISVIALGSNTMAQPTIKDVLPKSPNVASLGKYGDVPVSLSKGQLNLSIPLYTISYGDVEIPISLSYNNRGLKVAEVPTWVGHGWDLMVGGAIIRQVNGLPDDCSVGIFYQTDKLNKFYSNQFASTADRNAFLNEAAENEIDTQPDFYSYNINGRSGKFYFDKNRTIKLMPAAPLKVLVDYEPNSLQLKSFRIIDEKGFNYYFELGVSSQSSYSSNFPATTTTSDVNQGGLSSWLLTKMLTPTNRQVDFVYQSNGQIDKQDVSKVISLKQITPYDNAGMYFCPLSSFEPSSRFVTMNETVIKQVNFDLGRVEFERGAVRADIQNAYGATDMRSLASIKVFNKNNELIKKIGFDYEYFGSSVRLKLKRINFPDTDQLLNNFYEFSYINELSSYPSFHHNQPGFYSQDYWGFYNGKRNNSLNPTDNIPDAYTGYYAAPYSNWLADRHTDPEYAKIGLLNKIKYPTGGESLFEYQPNQVTYGSVSEGEMPQMFKNSINNPLISAVDENIAPDQTKTVSFTLPYDTDIVVSSIVSTNDYLGWYPPTVTITGPSDLQSKFNLNAVSESQGVTVHNFTFRGAKAGTYTVSFSTIPYQPQYSSMIYFNLNYAGNASNRIAFVDGLRIAKISDCVGPLNCKTRKFVYTDPRGIELPKFLGSSSRVVTSRLESNQMAVGVCDFIYLYDSPLNSPLGVEYEFVSEMFGENGENGKTDYKFLTVNQEGFSADPYPIPTYNTWVSGRIKEQKIYSKENSVYKLLEQTTTNYTSSWINNAQAVSQITDNGLKVSCYYRGDAGFGYNSSFNTGLTPLYSEFFRPVSTTSVKYFYNATGTSTQSTESVTYDYENLNHLQVTKTTKTTSDGKIKEIRQRYAQDSVANLTALATQAKAEMAARNMIANEIERIELLNGSITHGTRTNYDIRNSLVIPSNFQDKVGNNAYLTKAEINKHDNKGNFLQLTEINGISNVILWSHNSNLVIASITGVTFSQALSALGLTENEYLTESSLVHPSTNYMSRINNLRTQLPTAQIVTYTQKPLVGQAQINDINNKPTYYEYDSYGRLKFVRDNDNSLTKKYQYNIKQ